MSSSRTDLPPLWRALTALVAVLALGVGTFALHDPWSEHPGAPAEVKVEEAAQHPGDPIHFEASHLTDHPACGACVAQIQTEPLPGRLERAAPLLPPAGSVAGAVQTAPLSASFSSVPARAPPLHSASV
jgi:hypothetical protein